jgi:hypothetical protein
MTASPEARHHVQTHLTEADEADVHEGAPSVVVQAFKPARHDGPQSPHYLQRVRSRKWQQQLGQRIVEDARIASGQMQMQRPAMGVAERGEVALRLRELQRAK